MTKHASSAAHTATKARDYGDPQVTAKLYQHMLQPAHARDTLWRESFLRLISNAALSSGSPQVAEGPDGHLYFQLRMPSPGKTFQRYAISNLADSLLLEKGYGILFYSSLSTPEWTFSYGDILGLSIAGSLIPTDMDSIIRTKGAPDTGTHPLDGTYGFLLPEPARAIIAGYLQQYYAAPGVCVRYDEASLSFALVFNIPQKNLSAGKTPEQILTGLLWFLPRGYVCKIAEEGAHLPFSPLAP